MVNKDERQEEILREMQEEILTFTELWVVSMEHLKRVWHASRERLPIWTLCSVPFFLGGGGARMCFDFLNQFFRLYTELWPYSIWPSSNKERFQLNICDGCGMPTRSAYTSGHLLPCPFVGLACTPLVDQISRICCVLTRLFTLNTPRYFLEFVCLSIWSWPMWYVLSALISFKNY